MNKLELLLKGIPGVDYEAAIERMSDNTAIYVELLRLFFKDEPPKKLAAAIVRQDYKEAAYEAHSIKGTAANLGLTEISHLSAVVHMCLKNDEMTHLKVLLEKLEMACCRVKNITNQIDGGMTDAE